MASNEDKVRARYADLREEERESRSRAGSLEFRYTRKILAEVLTPEMRAVELGCGTGAYLPFFAERCRSYVGVDLVPEQVALARQKIAERGLANASAEVGDATALAFDDGSFDAVAALGPMYHLPPEERERVFAECARVCRPGGLAAFAYISGAGAMVKACLMWPDAYPNAAGNRAVFEEGTDDLRPGLFYFTSPEEMEERARENGFSVLRNAGVDFSLDSRLVDAMDEDRFAAWLGVCDVLCASPSCAGMADHSLLVCRREA